MADRLYRVQVSIPLESAVAEDAIVNTFYFDDDDDPVAGPEDTQGWILDKLTAFYQAVDSVMFPDTVGGNATVRMYDMRDPEPRVAKAEEQIMLNPSINAPLPNEVALCMSFQAERVSGQLQRRRRGRVFLGPVAESAVAVIGSHSRPLASVRNTIATAAEAMATPFLHPGSPGLHLNWSIYSRRTDELGASLDDSFHDVKDGWIDDAWDIQRRRGAAPTAREVWAV